MKWLKWLVLGVLLVGYPGWNLPTPEADQENRRYMEYQHQEQEKFYLEDRVRELQEKYEELQEEQEFNQIWED